jgi:mannose-6-phosphate isomerase-like protein (cupin superfamily)
MTNQGSGSAPAVRTPEQVPPRPAAAGVTVREMLGDADGCRGLHQRRLSLAGGSALAGTAGGRGEAWYVIRGSGTLAAEGHGTALLEPGTAVWMREGLGYEGRADSELEVLVVALQAEPAAERPGMLVVTLDACEPERTGDREFRVLLSEGLAFTQFAGLIPPGRAPEHHHTYDEVVHVLAGRGVVHLGGTTAEIGPGTSIYLPPYQPHCLENTGQDLLQVLGVFHPAGSPAAKHEA